MERKKHHVIDLVDAYFYNIDFIYWVFTLLEDYMADHITAEELLKILGNSLLKESNTSTPEFLRAWGLLFKTRK